MTEPTEKLEHTKTLKECLQGIGLEALDEVLDTYGYVIKRPEDKAHLPFMTEDGMLKDKSMARIKLNGWAELAKHFRELMEKQPLVGQDGKAYAVPGAYAEGGKGGKGGHGQGGKGGDAIAMGKGSLAIGGKGGDVTK